MSSLEFRCRLTYPSGFLLDASFETESQVTALFGPSGSGKTTILSMIAGLRTPESGFIRLDDAVLFDSEGSINKPPESRRIGYVFQQQLLFPHMTVHENLLYGWKRRPPSAASVDPRDAIRVLDLAPLLDRPPGTLSGGQRQRVAFARALLCAPRLLLLDEPLASVDAELKQEVLKYIDQILAQWRIPTLYVTHDAEEVSRMCTFVVRIKQGRVATIGKPDAVLGSVI